MRYTNTYSIKKSSRRRRYAIRYIQVSAVLLLMIGIAGLRFFVDQGLQSEASNTPQAQAVAQQPEPREAAEFETFSEAEPIPVDTSNDLQALLNSFDEQYADADVSVLVRSLDNSFSASINPDQQYDAASLYKTLAAYKVLQHIDAGSLTLTQGTSEGVTLERCIELAITVSDNECGIILQKLAGSSQTDIDAQEWGYAQTTLSGFYPQTSAIDQHALFKDIYLGERLSESSAQLLQEYLANQQILNRTPVYEDAQLYLKTGDVRGTVNSTALIETTSGAYTVSVLTDNWSESLLSKYSAIETIHRDIHSVVTN